MESIYAELALCSRKNKCARTDTVFFPISEVSEGTVVMGFLRIVCMKKGKSGDMSILHPSKLL